MARIFETNGKEVSVAWAARRLQCSARSITYYLKERKLEGVKVGKDWHIDRASVEAHAARYGIPDPFVETPAPAGSPPTAQTEPSSEPDKPAVQKSNRRPPKPLTTLNVFRLYTKAASPLTDFLAKATEPDCRDQIKRLHIGAVENLGAGYYSHGPKKTEYYSQARAQMGALVSTFHCDTTRFEDLRNFIHELETEILPALGALIRYIEMGKRRHRNPGEKTSDE